MRVKWNVLIIILSIGLTGIVAAAELNVTSGTYLQARESADVHHLLPLFENLDFNLDDFQNETLAAHWRDYLTLHRIDGRINSGPCLKYHGRKTMRGAELCYK